jgi:hypothetical protein
MYLMKRMMLCAAFVVLALAPVSVMAQWLDLPTPGIPRTG